jgi:hypothetical protein
MFKYLQINTEKNALLCSTELVGVGELVELHQAGEATPMQITGKILKKLADPNLFVIHATYETQDFVGKKYSLAENCIFRVAFKTMSGTRRRKFSEFEKFIVNTEHGPDFKDTEVKVVKAKTGSVRKKDDEE